jgi:hypothetical protein
MGKLGVPGIGGRLWPEPFEGEMSKLALEIPPCRFNACGEFADEELRRRCEKPPIEEEEEIEEGFKDARSTVGDQMAL